MVKKIKVVTYKYLFLTMSKLFDDESDEGKSIAHITPPRIHCESSRGNKSSCSTARVGVVAFRASHIITGSILLAIRVT